MELIAGDKNIEKIVGDFFDGVSENLKDVIVNAISDANEYNDMSCCADQFGVSSKDGEKSKKL